MPETEATAMRMMMEHERAQRRQVFDVSDKHLGYEVTSGATGTILLTPNERRVAEDRRDCHRLDVVTNCHTTPWLQDPVRDPARLAWPEIAKVAHDHPCIDAVTKPIQLREERTAHRAPRGSVPQDER